jgi:hypothetical protein
VSDRQRPEAEEALRMLGCGDEAVVSVLGHNDSVADCNDTWDSFEEDSAVHQLDQTRVNVLNALWTVSFTFIVVVGTCGNGIVLWIILCE